MTCILTLTAAQMSQFEAEARAAWPRECCGLIEGAPESLRVVALHPARNLADGDNQFEIDPAGQFRLMRALRGSGRAIIGCYHSHPGGSLQPSERDISGAAEEDFVWLIASTDATNAKLGAWLWRGGAFVPISIVLAG